jgi:sulfotransferase
MKRIVFVSGLPRAGSTLLAAILRQNPAVQADMSSPVLNMVSVVQRSLSRAQEFAINVDDAARIRVMRGLFENYYSPYADKIVFDTNRAWTTKLDLLPDLFPEAKIICCVRSLGAILESFERIFRANRLQTSAMMGFDPETNAYNRVDRLMVAGGVVGAALNSLKDAFYGPNSERLLLISYDRLAGQPKLTMEAVYNFIGAADFAHDFDNVAFAAAEFDAAFGMNGLHTVGGKVALRRRQPTLPPDLAAMFSAPEFWNVPGQNSKATCLV